jgi:methylamine dehydrogenase accessory protein MauD
MEIIFYSNILLWVLQVFIIFCLFMIFRQFGKVYLSSSEGISRDGIAIGDSIIPYEGVSFFSDKKITANSLPNRPTLMVFISSGCKACKDLIPEWNEAFLKYNDQVNFVLVGVGTKEHFINFTKNRSVRGELILDPERVIFRLFKARVTPFAFIFNEKGVVKGKGLCNGLEHISGLISQLNTVSEEVLESSNLKKGMVN